MKIPLKELMPVLNLVKGFVADKNILPALTHLYFKEDSVRAFSGSAGAVWYTPWSMGEEPLILPAEDMVTVFQSLFDQGIEEVDLNPTATQVTVKAGRFRGSLPKLVIDDAPTTFMQRAAPPRQVETGKDFWDDVDRVAFSVCKDATKPSLRGVCWASSGRLFTADSARIATLAPRKGAALKPPIAAGLLIPDHLLERLAGNRSKVTGVGMEGESILWCFMDPGMVFGSLMEGAFPITGTATIVKKIQDASKTRGTTINLVSAGMLGHVMARLLYFVKPPTFRVAGVIEKDALKLTVVDEDGGMMAEESLPAVSVTGKQGGSFFVNGKFFSQALESVNSEFWLGDEPTDPLYFRSEDKRLEHLVIRLVA